VHFARTAEEAREIIARICREAGARTVTKGKSMIAEEVGLNAHLEAAGIVPVETDLGEYIIQLRNELPSHIIAPAVHLNATQVEADFRRVHTHLDAKRDLSEPVQLLSEARAVLRERFLAADVGITGANFLVAETGTSVIVTNEGNGGPDADPAEDPHRAGLDREARADAGGRVADPARARPLGHGPGDVGLHHLLDRARRRPQDVDGPEHYHVVILDNGRSAMLGTAFEEMLRCIRCGACMNHCPGLPGGRAGHAYGWVYPGPMGRVLTPTLIGVDKAGHLPQRLHLLRPLRERAARCGFPCRSSCATGASASSSAT
jgi:L-lactate dehydrogenase complex protein LldF